MPTCMQEASEEELEQQVGSGTQALYWSKATSHVQNYTPIEGPQHARFTVCKERRKNNRHLAFPRKLLVPNDEELFTSENVSLWSHSSSSRLLPELVELSFAKSTGAKAFGRFLCRRDLRHCSFIVFRSDKLCKSLYALSGWIFLPRKSSLSSSSPESLHASQKSLCTSPAILLRKSD